jgi:hypothetical protein
LPSPERPFPVLSATQQFRPGTTPIQNSRND